jgi:hypothetical protein
MKGVAGAGDDWGARNLIVAEVAAELKCAKMSAPSM